MNMGKVAHNHKNYIFCNILVVLFQCVKTCATGKNEKCSLECLMQLEY